MKLIRAHQRALLLIFFSVFSLGACSQATPAETPTLSFPANTSTSSRPSPTPTLLAIAVSPALLPTPSYTSDPEAQRYLQGVEDILRHSARILPDLTLGLGHVCPERYVIAFVYVEPDARGGQTLYVDALTRNPDGAIHTGEHDIIWSIQREGLYWDRWNHIYLTDHSEVGSFQIEFLLEEPQGSGWRVGTAFGTCPGDDLHLSGLFIVDDPLDFTLLYTRYDSEAPYDFWLQDGEQLLHYQWERWTETLLWTLEETPGRLVSVEWTQDSPDVNGDGQPDLVLHWDIDGEDILRAFTANGTGFTPIEKAGSN